MSSDSSSSDSGAGWFDRKENVKKILTALYVGCGVMLLIELLYLVFGHDKHPYLNWEKWPGFYGIFGFVSCVVLVLVAKYILRPIVKRSEDFYEEGHAVSKEGSETKGESDDD